MTDLITHADELADTFGRYEPTSENFDAPLPPLMAVKLAAFRRSAAEEDRAEAIHHAREARVSWREFGGRPEPRPGRAVPHRAVRPETWGPS